MPCTLGLLVVACHWARNFAVSVLVLYKQVLTCPLVECAVLFVGASAARVALLMLALLLLDATTNVDDADASVATLLFSTLSAPIVKELGLYDVSLETDM